MALSAKQIAAIPSMTLSQLEKSDHASVWVFNLSGSAELKDFKRGIINISVNDGIGNTISLRVPITWVPVDLTTQVTKTALVMNPQFRRLASAGILKIISEESALEIVSTPEGRKETVKVHAAEKYSGDLGDSGINVDNDVISTSNINAIVISVVNRDDLDEDACISVLEGHEMTMNTSDFEYLAKNSRYAGVKDWAISRI